MSRTTCSWCGESVREPGEICCAACRGTDRHLKGGRPLPPESITCPRCGATSFHPDDVRAGYCGRCHWWTSDRTLGAPQVIAWAEAEGVIEPLSTR